MIVTHSSAAQRTALNYIRVHYVEIYDSELEVGWVMNKFLRTDSTDSPDCLPILLSLSVFTFLFFFFPLSVFGSVR